MKAKTLNVQSPLFTNMEVSHYGRDTHVLVRLDYDGAQFIIREAYINTKKVIRYGTVADNLPFLNAIINEWYNAKMDFERGAMFVDGYVNMVGNHEFERQFADVKAKVALMTTKRAQKDALKLHAK